MQSTTFNSLDELCHQVEHFLVFHFTNMSSMTGLVWNFLGGLIFPLLAWTFGEFIPE